MDFIYDILDNKKFQEIFIPKDQEYKEIKDKDDILFNEPREKEKKARLSHFSVYHVLESFMGCVIKVLQLLFIERKEESRQLYETVFDRLGESVLALVNGSYVQIMKKMKRNSAMFQPQEENYFQQMEMMISL